MTDRASPPHVKGNGRTKNSTKQAEANRSNALKSTGPKTPAGKIAVRRNATKHGLRSQELLLPNEDPAALTELTERLRTDLKAVGEMENILADTIVSAVWRLRRLKRIEAGILTWEFYKILVQRAQTEAGAYESNDALKSIEMLQATIITDEKKHAAATSKARDLQAIQTDEIPTLGSAFINDSEKADALSKLSRYEAMLERSFYRAFHELQRVQATRKGKKLSPPVAVDVNVSRDEEDI